MPKHLALGKNKRIIRNNKREPFYFQKIYNLQVVNHFLHFVKFFQCRLK